MFKFSDLKPCEIQPFEISVLEVMLSQTCAALLYFQGRISFETDQEGPITLLVELCWSGYF